MAATTRIPPLLVPYLNTSPPTSLALITSVLGASANWLVLRFILAALSTKPTEKTGFTESLDERDGNVAVVLISFLRDWDFWREGGRRMGLDFGKLTLQNRLCFVDGLSKLFTLKVEPGFASGKETGRIVLRDARIEALKTDILAAVDGLARGMQAPNGVLLILDGLDLVLAATGVDMQTMTDMLIDVREHVHSTVITASADSPLTQSPSTPLEINHAAFVTGLVYQARFVMGVRLLDTGTARDISGVLRITRGSEGEEVEEREVLYFVGGDGGVRVFERGA